MIIAERFQTSEFSHLSFWSREKLWDFEDNIVFSTPHHYNLNVMLSIYSTAHDCITDMFLPCSNI